jgi:tripartite-type tricarboxylate transporter receptor subunit TctC
VPSPLDAGTAPTAAPRDEPRIGSSPAGTAPAIIAKMHAATMAILADPEIRRRVAGLGLDIVASTPEQMHATIAADIPKWAKVIADAGIKPGG